MGDLTIQEAASFINAAEKDSGAVDKALNSSGFQQLEGLDLYVRNKLGKSSSDKLILNPFEEYQPVTSPNDPLILKAKPPTVPQPAKTDNEENSKPEEPAEQAALAKKAAEQEEQAKKKENLNGLLADTKRNVAIKSIKLASGNAKVEDKQKYLYEPNIENLIALNDEASIKKDFLDFYSLEISSLFSAMIKGSFQKNDEIFEPKSITIYPYYRAEDDNYWIMRESRFNLKDKDGNNRAVEGDAITIFKITDEGPELVGMYTNSDELKAYYDRVVNPMNYYGKQAVQQGKDYGPMLATFAVFASYGIYSLADQYHGNEVLSNAMMDVGFEGYTTTLEGIKFAFTPEVVVVVAAAISLIIAAQTLVHASDKAGIVGPLFASTKGIAGMDQNNAGAKPSTTLTNTRT